MDHHSLELQYSVDYRVLYKNTFTSENSWFEEVLFLYCFYSYVRAECVHDGCVFTPTEGIE